ncbi:hypothetical protein M8756_15145 [Lutimaribacter sp. EGI FJ00015]|uniref:Uncharacterized protein n=1 Tax=Lutimaribacter degradans TaxID=2945989 RepID=A0ACC5ZZE1_9RHOB|nr:hypothetical protein [Lutimaribacter sp. EGI FJ00013]MCM2563475.1 hypothetical protein [Lutimaribacter sp. EGI FJ00013]MCO0614655.1 hypothetical protein [Lutimaribacter sp. EGI FJ00015]MCO0637326.1 hypothetical protein [Lutimaribacter sp. EGI FJ00014]
MSIHDLSDGKHLIAGSLGILNSRGISIRFGEDLDEYQEILAKHRPDQPIGAPFDPNLQHLTPETCFWMIGETENGTLVHTQALRLIDMRYQTLADYLRDNFRAFPPVLPDLDLARSRYRAGPGARMITGRVCYQGEFWFNPDRGAYRGSGLAGIVGRCAFFEAIKRWAPDYTFGFMAYPVATKGFAQRQGYLHSEPGALRWARYGSDEPLEGFMVYNSLEDLRYLLSLPVVEKLPEMAA